MTEIPPESAADPTDGDILPDDVPDSMVIASALHQHLHDWDKAEELADAVLVRLGEYRRVVARLPDGVVHAREAHHRVASKTSHVLAEWVDTAVDAWHEAEPGLLLDDQMRRVIAAVGPLIAEQACTEERAGIAAKVRERLDEAVKTVIEYQWGHVAGTVHTMHLWENECAVCRGDVAAILAVALPVLVGRDG